MADEAGLNSAASPQNCCHPTLQNLNVHQWNFSFKYARLIRKRSDVYAFQDEKLAVMLFDKIIFN